MKDSGKVTQLLALAATAVALAPIALVQADNALFSMQEADRQNQPVAQEGLSVLEGKCGEGKCGTLRIRLMMDLDGNSVISRDEYVTWAAAQADSEFDRIAGLHGSNASAESVFEGFRKNNAGR